MNTGAALTLERQLAAANAWWREAGVDLVFSDEPRAWLPSDNAPAAPAPAQVEPAGERRPAIGGPPESWPRDLAAFREWWLGEPTLDLGGTGPRIAPRGAAEPELMILVPMPEAGDGDTLLSGKEGRLVAAMLAAMGIARDKSYLAAALPRHMAQPDWDGLGRGGLGAVLRHHLALARPRRLLVLGHAVLPLLGHDRAQAAGAIRHTATEAAIHAAETRPPIPTLVGFAPDRLLDNARQRANLWRQWLDWTREDR